MSAWATFSPGCDLAECKKQLDDIFPALRFTFFRQDTKPVAIRDAFPSPDDLGLLEKLVSHFDKEHNIDHGAHLLSSDGVSSDLVCR